MRQPATAIIPYKIVQAGPNSQFGGLQVGFASAEYHPAIWGRVKNAAVKATT
ncbi:MAG: hypothetical protein PVS2B2_01100 [Candidatus Acidiferrum sp.]